MEEIEELHEHLWQELHRIDHRWRLWCNWFSNDPERVELLNMEASGTFSLLQSMILEAVVLSSSRMADRHRICGKETASFAALIERCECPDEEVTERHSEFRISVEKLKSWRNSHIAHTELAKIASGPDLEIRVLEVTACLKSAVELLNSLSKHFGKSPTLLFAETHVGVDLVNAFKRSKHLKTLVSGGEVFEGELYLAIGPHSPELRAVLQQRKGEWLRRKQSE